VKAGPGPVALAISDVDGDGNLEIAVQLGLGQSLALCRYERAGRVTEVRHVPLPNGRLPGGGPQGWVFPWQSEQQGPGFLVIVPLASQPFCFVPCKGGEPGAVQVSPLPGEGVIVSASRVRTGPPASDLAPRSTRLAVLVNGRGSRVLMLQEKDGKLEAVPNEKPLSFDEQALSLAVADWNLDGVDDLAIVLRNSVSLFFRVPDGFVEGPRFKDLGPFEGTVAAADFNGDGRPDLLLVTEAHKVRFLLSKVTEPPPPPPEPPKGAGQEKRAAPAKKEDEAAPKAATPQPADAADQKPGPRPVPEPKGGKAP
jgi:hypothetical protein